MTKLVPKYSIFEAIGTALSLSMKALEEIRNLARLPGPRGPDGLGFDDMTMEHDGERGFKFVFARGSEKKEFAFTVPMMIYRGIYQEGRVYAKGDVTTWGGSMWHSDADNVTERPSDTAKTAWKLVVKRGRDGKEVVSLPPKSGPVKI